MAYNDVKENNIIPSLTLKKQQSPFILDLCLSLKTRAGKSHDNPDAIAFKKLCFQKNFRPYENEKPAFSNSSGLKSVFEKLNLRDGLVWTVGLTVEIKLRFTIPPTEPIIDDGSIQGSNLDI